MILINYNVIQFYVTQVLSHYTHEVHSLKGVFIEQWILQPYERVEKKIAVTKVNYSKNKFI